MDDLTRNIRQGLLARGADLVGIAPIERFNGIPPEKHPSSIFPEVRSVVVIGLRLPRGSMRGIEEGSYFGSLSAVRLAATWLPWFYHLAVDLFEDNGWEAVPIFAHDEVDLLEQGVPVADGRPAPNVAIDIDDAAVRAGLGERGRHGLFLTPEFGTLQMFLLILTDALLSPNEIRSAGVCDDCGECLKACPLQAIGDGAVVDMGTGGSEMPVTAVNLKRCRRCQNGMINLPYSAIPCRVAAACARACYVHLEAKGLLKNGMQPFRRRAPWIMVDDEVISGRETGWESR